MKLTKQGHAALERAELNKEGENESFANSPYKQAMTFHKLWEELVRNIKMGV